MDDEELRGWLPRSQKASCFCQKNSEFSWKRYSRRMTTLAKKISPEIRAKLREIEDELRKLQQMVHLVADEFDRRAAGQG